MITKLGEMKRYEVVRKREENDRGDGKDGEGG